MKQKIQITGEHDKTYELSNTVTDSDSVIPTGAAVVDYVADNAGGGGETVVRVNKFADYIGGGYSPVETTSSTFQDTGISWALVSGKTYFVDMFIEVLKNTSDAAQLMISNAFDSNPYTEMQGTTVFGGQDASGNTYSYIDPTGNGDFIQISIGMPSSATGRVFLQFKGILIAANTTHKLFINRSSGTTTSVSVNQFFASFVQLD